MSRRPFLRRITTPSRRWRDMPEFAAVFGLVLAMAAGVAYSLWNALVPERLEMGYATAILVGFVIALGLVAHARRPRHD